MNQRRPPVFLTVLFALLLPPLARAAEPPGIARLALVVGANAAAPGRRALSHGHRDAEKLAATLTSVGGFRTEDVTLLRDPGPDVLLAELGRTIARIDRKRETLLYFYYSGHADDQALYPGGRPVAMDKVRALLDGAPAQVRIGMIDACRGGGWTRAKGLSPDEPFTVRWPLSLDNEGSVLIASSSGLESAHESDDLQGSFFTHHFVVGMRGGADRDADGAVTLNEAFEYAQERTIRDSLRMARETQRPSYAVNLRGRRDLVLAHIGEGASTVELAQQHGPLELIHVESGVELLELAPGVRRVKLVVPPGRYLVRKLFPESTLVKEVTIAAGDSTRIEEAQLSLVGSSRLAAKAVTPATWVITEGVAARPPAPRATPLSVKWAAVSGATAGLLATAMAVKFSLDVGYYNDRLDRYRRFACSPPNQGQQCDSRGQVAPPLTPEQLDWVRLESEEGKRYQTYQSIAMGVAAGAFLLSAPFFYRWIRGEQPARPDKVSLRLSPTLSPAGQGGVAAVGRF